MHCPGGGVSAHGCVCGRPRPVNRMTDRCKNITLPQGKNEKNFDPHVVLGARVCCTEPAVYPGFCVNLLLADDLNLKSEYHCRLFQENAKLVGRIFSKVKQRRRICLTRIVTVYSSLYVLLLLTLLRFTRTHCT